MRLNDLLQSYQDLLPEPAAQGEIVRLVPPDLHVQTIDFNVPDVLIGNGDLSLQPFDTVRVLGRYETDAPKVEIRGEVQRPGSYPLSEGMTAAQLVRMAGGFKRDALVETADLISYRVVDGTKIESQRSDVRIGDAVDRGNAAADRELKAGDVITIHQITGWNDIGASITIEGEVAHPGSYGFQQGERLSDVLRRTGGFRETAYPAGAVLVREQVRELEEKSRLELIRQIETNSAAAHLSSNTTTTEQSGQAQTDSAATGANSIAAQKSAGDGAACHPHYIGHRCVGRNFRRYRSTSRRRVAHSQAARIRVGEWPGLQPIGHYFRSRENRWVVSAASRGSDDYRKQKGSLCDSR